MEFVRVGLRAFGALKDFDTGEEPLTRLVAVLGPNEAGKSTLFHFLTAVLYGFYPASRDRNPYSPWRGGDIEGEAVLRMQRGERWEVRRRLLASPSGTLIRESVSEELRNRTLPCAEHVPREVFRQVFALTLSDLTTLAGESWERVQDRLITGMGARDLASVRTVVDDLQREAGRLWRPTRVGNQRLRDLQQRVRELRLRRRTAADNDRKLRAASVEREEVEIQLREARNELETCRLFVEGCQRLLPLRDRLRRIDALRRRAGPERELDGLPLDPAGRLAELDSKVARLEESLASLAAETREPRERIEAFGPQQRALADRSREIRTAIATATGVEPGRARARQLESEIERLERRSEDASRELFRDPWAVVDRDAVLAVPLTGLRRALERYRAVTERSRDARGPGQVGGALSYLGPLLAIAGAITVVTAFIIGRVALAVPGALLVGVGGALVAVRSGGRIPGGSGSGSGTQDPDEREALHTIAEILSGLPIRPELARRPPIDLAGSFERLQDLVAHQRERTAELVDLEGDIEGCDDALQTLANELGAVPSTPAMAFAHQLESQLQDAETRERKAAAARHEMDRIERERARLGSKLEETAEERRRLEDRLERLAGDDGSGSPADAVRERLEAMELARQLDAELRREHPDREGLLERLRRFEAAHGEQPVSDVELASARSRAEELGDKIEGLTRRLEGLRKDIEYLGREEPMGAIDGEIEAIRMEIAAAVRARDRLWVLAALLREADRRFKEEHQPDVLRRAGCHLSIITGGRCERILVDESDRERFLLDGPGYPGPIEVGDPISTGTREQVYLALRLAILDHLDQAGERLPLFIDEAFVNWDPARRERAFGILEEVARTRQVFVFTCHDDMAGSLAARGARVVVLDARE